MMLSGDLLAPRQCVGILENLFDAGVFVPAVGYPTVVQGKARLPVPRTSGNSC
jgi:7-keto-8-aminopelargonate synthetase-like enzyme